MSRFTAGYVLALIVALSCATFSFAQVNTGSIGGTVSDPGGAAVPAATVVATNDQTQLGYEKLSSETGLYVFPSLPTGMYTVTAGKTGFKKASRGGLEVRVASRI